MLVPNNGNTIAPIKGTTETELMLKGHGPVLINVLYGMPDYPNVLNAFIWQVYDLAPDYPRLTRFVNYWRASLDAPIRMVEFTHDKCIRPGEWRNVRGEYRIN